MVVERLARDEPWLKAGDSLFSVGELAEVKECLPVRKGTVS